MHIDDIRSVVGGSGMNTSEQGFKVSLDGSDKQDGKSIEKDAAAAFYGGNFLSRIKNPGYDKKFIQDETLAEQLARESEGFSNAQNMKHNLSMAAAGFSVEDLSGMEESGYDAKDMDEETFVSVLDRIKMHLAMGGKDISMMGGLSKDEVAAISGGSASLQATIESALSAADLPYDEDVLSDILQTVQKTDELQETLADEAFTDGVKEYLLNGSLAPTVENIYNATSSGTYPKGAGVELSETDIEEMMPQIEGIVDEANLAFDDMQRDNAVWMLRREIPITPENVTYLNKLQEAKPDLSQEAVISRISEALAEDRQPNEAYLLDGFSIKDRAEEAYEVIQGVSDEQIDAVIEERKELTIENLSAVKQRDEQSILREGVMSGEISKEALAARRVVEEARIIMTQQANYSLMKRGISVDTTELSDLIDEINSLEKEFFSNTLFGAEETVTDEELSLRMERFDNTNQAIAELKAMPAATLGIVGDIGQATLSSLHSAGADLAREMANATERYETMGTQVRRDLGDSIKKAFRNVDDILDDIGLETSESNRRAVRILAYNTTEINTHEVARMKEGDELVQRAFKNLTPGVVARMIKDGENPLDLSMEELNEKAEGIKAVSSSSSSEENFAEFLYKAQHSGELTQEERDAYIGVYRLIYQVEKSDGAVIGQLLNQGEELTLRNMMMAVRTRRHENREYDIDDNFGFAEFDKSALSITDQIEMAFMTKRMKDAKDAITPGKLRAFESEDEYLDMNPDEFAGRLEEMESTPADIRANEAYIRASRDDIERAIRQEQRVYDMLDSYDMPTSPANLEAMAEMLSDRNAMYRNIFRMNRSAEREVFGTEDLGVRTGDIDLSDVIDDLIREFGEAVKTPEEMAEAQRNLEEVAENVMKTMLVEQPAGSIDIRGMQVSMKQIRTLGEIGQKSETYAVPILVEDSLGNMTLKIVRGRQEQRGQVDLALNMESTGQIRASFKYDTDGVYGTVTSSVNETSKRINEALDEMRSAIEEVTGEDVDINVSYDRRCDANSIFYDEDVDFETSDVSEGRSVQTRMLYGIARTFIDSISRVFA